ncbi:hypothetical protein B0H11DRAFT_1905859 [Mycena galericulata]|nr:hypothetical protein B0H11DRAFT_1905859 [Mycena galericulata]
MPMFNVAATGTWKELGEEGLGGQCRSRPITHEYGLLVVSTNKDASPKQYGLNTAETPSEPCYGLPIDAAHLGRLFRVSIGEEATLWTYHDTTRNPGATEASLDRTLPLAKGCGYSVRADFRATVLRNGRRHVPVLGENKRAISRRGMAPSGWPATSKGHQGFIIPLQRAVSQVELQAVVLFKLDRDASDKANRQSAVFMIAAVGPIYVWAFATSEGGDRGCVWRP